MSASNSFRLEVAAGTGGTGAGTLGYLMNTGASSGYNAGVNEISVKINGRIWATSMVIASDSRIKEDIQDINDDSALQSILAIEPKTYKYIDKVIRGDNKVYGFIAQQIREVIPEAVSIQTSYIPNIMVIADFADYVITLPSQPEKVIIKVDDKISCYDKDNKLIDVVVEEVIDELTFRIKEIPYTDNKIFVYGTEIYDFNTLNKDYIFTLNVCATQELHRRMETQDKRIKELETKLEKLINYIYQ